MATVVKCEIDGLRKNLELYEGGLSLGYFASANVRSASNNKQITFGPANVDPFTFSVSEPDKEAIQFLIKWIVSHEIKNKVTFKISDREMDAQTRDLVLEQVCLESYREYINETGLSITLTLVAQKITVGDVSVDQTDQR